MQRFGENLWQSSEDVSDIQEPLSANFRNIFFQEIDFTYSSVK